MSNTYCFENDMSRWPNIGLVSLNMLQIKLTSSNTIANIRKWSIKPPKYAKIATYKTILIWYKVFLQRGEWFRIQHGVFSCQKLFVGPLYRYIIIRRACLKCTAQNVHPSLFQRQNLDWGFAHVSMIDDVIPFVLPSNTMLKMRQDWTV